MFLFVSSGSPQSHWQVAILCRGHRQASCTTQLGHSSLGGLPSLNVFFSGMAREVFLLPFFPLEGCLSWELTCSCAHVLANPEKIGSGCAIDAACIGVPKVMTVSLCRGWLHMALSLNAHSHPVLVLQPSVPLFLGYTTLH